MALVAIHQPNFLPWLGFFDKIARADVFVLLDSAQFPKKGGTWINRVRILVNGEPSWLTVPIERAYHGTRSIREMRVRDEDRRWREGARKTLRSAYGRAPFFASVQAELEPLVEDPTDELALYNERAIRRLCELLGLVTPLVRASELTEQGTGTARLVSLVHAAGGDGYLVGGGADGYQEDDVFAAAGIELLRQDFVPPRYPQGTGEHHPGLSVVDALMRVGFQGTRALLAR
jgi:WbqC-like protein family